MDANDTEILLRSRDEIDDAASGRSKIDKSWMYSEQSSPALLYALGVSPNRKHTAKSTESLFDAETAAFPDDTALAPAQNS